MGLYRRAAGVSTHSRLKAAARIPRPRQALRGFNTQPPEGGCTIKAPKITLDGVSTHSRLKAAGLPFNPYKTKQNVSTHSRLKAAVLIICGA